MFYKVSVTPHASIPIYHLAVSSIIGLDLALRCELFAQLIAASTRERLPSRSRQTYAFTRQGAPDISQPLYQALTEPLSSDILYSH